MKQSLLSRQPSRFLNLKVPIPGSFWLGTRCIEFPSWLCFYPSRVCTQSETKWHKSSEPVMRIDAWALNTEQSKPLLFVVMNYAKIFSIRQRKALFQYVPFPDCMGWIHSFAQDLRNLMMLFRHLLICSDDINKITICHNWHLSH